MTLKLKGNAKDCITFTFVETKGNRGHLVEDTYVTEDNTLKNTTNYPIKKESGEVFEEKFGSDQSYRGVPLYDVL